VQAIDSVATAPMRTGFVACVPAMLLGPVVPQIIRTVRGAVLFVRSPETLKE